jgi:hypothetical protein
MPFNEWGASLVAQQAAGPAVTGTAQVSVLNGQAKYTIGAQWLKYIGQKMRIRAAGIISTAAAPGTIAWSVLFGSIVVYAGGASGTLAVSQSNLPWTLDLDLTVRAVGSGTLAALAGFGEFKSAALSATVPLQILACPGALTGFDSTIANLIDLQVTLGSASDSITCEAYELIDG